MALDTLDWTTVPSIDSLALYRATIKSHQTESPYHKQKPCRDTNNKNYPAETWAIARDTWVCDQDLQLTLRFTSYAPQ